MNLITRFKGWLRRWRRKRASRGRRAALREFVYLDEVSVYSLIASRLGPIAAEFTETETASLQGEVASSISAGAGLAKAEVNSRLLDVQTHGSQVLRRSIVQTTFKELYELEMESLVIRPVSGGQKPPELKSLDDLLTATATLANDGWIVDPDNLIRGQLLEVEVQLEAEAIFRISAVVSAFLEILEEDPEIFGFDSNVDIVQMKSIDRIIGKLLVGLVPIRGYATDYRVVELRGKAWIVHCKLLSEITGFELPPARQLFVVGVAEQTLFWKDIRRILFSKARFRVLCRMAQDGIQNSWTPVKLAHVLETVMPGLANQLDTARSGALGAMITEAGTSNRSAELKQQLMHKALVSYAVLLADHYHLDITAPDLDQVGLLSEQHCASYGNQKGRREAFDAIATFLIDRFGIKREPLVFAQYRAVALEDTGLHFSGQVMPLVASDEVSSTASSDDGFLDTEFVAIYW